MPPKRKQDKRNTHQPDKQHEVLKHDMVAEARGSATALTQDEFPVIFGAIAVVAGVAHAMNFAIGYMLCGRVELTCNLWRKDFSTTPGSEDYGCVRIRGINRKTYARESWMTQWLLNVFGQEQIVVEGRAVACGRRGGKAHASAIEDSVWHVPRRMRAKWRAGAMCGKIWEVV